jgi:pimeloyl-ACP methyl ester carboxylesterase
MGGLISWYALTQYPEVFGGAGCLSTHWPAGSKEVDDPVFQAMKSYFRDSFPRAGNHKIYFDYGTETLDSLYEPFQNEMDQVVRNLGYVEGDDWMTRKFPGHEHSERAWGKRLHIPVKFLLGK